MTAPDSSRHVVDRWRQEVRRALPGASPDVVEEVAEHLGSLWQAAVDAGVDPTDADRQTRADLASWRPRGTADSPSPRWLRFSIGWLGELRQAGRLFSASPAFAGGIVGLTALAVAAAVPAFAIAYGLLWRALPYPDGERLAVLWQVQQGEEGQVSLPDFRDLSAADVFEVASALSGGRGSLRVGDEIDRVNGLFADPAAFTMLGARAQLGRLLTADDAGRPNALISDRVWRRRFGAAADIVGRPIWMSGQTYTVVGVLWPGFDFELPVADRFFLERHDLWMVLPPPDPQSQRRDVTNFEALVRLRPGVSLREAQAAVDTVGAQLASSFATTNAGRTFRLTPLRDAVVARMRQPLALGALAALVTLVIALANMITLVTVRLSARHTELAVRHALGAGTLRLRRHILTEHVVLVAAGTALGVGAAQWIVARLLASSAAHLPHPDAITFDGPVLAATAAIGVIVVFTLTVLPLRRGHAADALRKGSRVEGGDRRWRRGLIAVQVGLALTLASAGALVGLSLLRLTSLDPGFAAGGVSAARVTAVASAHAERADVERFVSATVAALDALPGVARAAAGSSLPLSGQSTGTGVTVEGQPLPPSARPGASWEFVTPAYFETLGIAVRSGRTFEPRDRERTGHVTIINEALARLLFPDGNAVGRRLFIGGDDNDPHEIVGVVADVRHYALAEPSDPRVYDLLGQHWGRTVYLVTRAETGQPPLMATTIRRVVAGVDPEAPVFEAATLDDLVARSAAPQVLTAAVAAGLAFAALALALAGVAAMAASAVAQRRREMGVRAALGASPADVFWLMLRESAATVSIGAAVGIAGAVGAAQLLTARVFGLASADALFVVPVVAVALAAAGVASSLPSARAAARSNPVDAMRAE